MLLETCPALTLTYDPPAGLVGHVLAEIFGVDPKQALDDDMARLKSLFEEGKTRVGRKVVTRDEVGPRPVTREIEAMRMAGT